MKYKAILFDLDGTLMPMSNETFMNTYLPTLGNHLKDYVDPNHLFKAMWSSLDDMLKDETQETNETVFFKSFGDILGHDLVKEMEPLFLNYYQTDFEILKTQIGDNTTMVKAVDYLKDKGYKLIIATNPMFPEVAVHSRLGYSRFRVDDFDFISNYSIHSACKPNLNYYQEVLDFNGLKAEDCLMIGNDSHEDVVVKELGMDAWLLNEYLIETDYTKEADWIGSRAEFLDKLKEVF